ncbi:MAG: hypothetical protein AAF298_00355 [Cyanobacteria bacterium P01_A01_bin.40]
MFDVWLHINEIHHPSDGNLAKPPEFDLKRYLHRKEISKFGLKRSVTFYGTYDQTSDQYDVPLCAVSWQTVFDGTTPKEQIKRTAWLFNGKWLNLDEQILKIEQPKVYLQAMRRRVIEELNDLADQFGLADKLKTLYEAHPNEIYVYKEGGSPQFRQAIASSTESWLDLPSTDGRTVRDVIVQYLSIGVVENEAN